MSRALERLVAPVTIVQVAAKLGMQYDRCRRKLMKLRKSDERLGRPIDWIEKEHAIGHGVDEAPDGIRVARWIVNLARLELAHPQFFRPRAVVEREDLEAIHEALGGLRRDCNRLASALREARLRIVALEARGSSERSEPVKSAKALMSSDATSRAASIQRGDS